VATRRNFIAAIGAVAVGRLLPRSRDSYWCECGLVQYVRGPEGHFAASHFAGQRFTYGLYGRHKSLHRLSRMWMLIEIGKYRQLTAAEKEELQNLFARVAVNDARVQAEFIGG
jgi:hypothetical protein